MDFHHDQRGTSAVEFAFVLPLFLTLLFGIVIFGSYLGTVHSVQQIAAEAARAAIAGLSDSERAALARQAVDKLAPSYFLLDIQRLAIEAAQTDAAGTFAIRLRYDASGSFIYALTPFLPMPSPEIVRAAAIQRGGY